MYTFALYDIKNDLAYVGRDPLGIKPLYYGKTINGSTVFASEMKGIAFFTDDVNTFPPGHVYDCMNQKMKRFFFPMWDAPVSISISDCSSDEDLYSSIRSKFEKSGKRCIHI